MGLMPTPTQGPPFADPNAPAQQPAPTDPSGDQSNVSPEDQQLYDTVVGKAADLIYGQGKVMQPILDALKPAAEAGNTGDPTADAQAAQTKPGDGDGADPESASEDQGEGKGGNPAILSLANTAVQIVSKLDASSKQAGQPIPDDVLYHAGSEIVSMLAEVAEAAGFHNYSDEEINGAFIQAVDMYRPIAEAMGRTDDQTLKGQFSDILNADAQGQLGNMLPGLGDTGQTGQDQQQPQPQPQPQQ